MDGIDDSSITWEEVPFQCMSGLWQKLLPEFILNSAGFYAILALQKEGVSIAKLPLKGLIAKVWWNCWLHR